MNNVLKTKESKKVVKLQQRKNLKATNSKDEQNKLKTTTQNER
jgi:hypothetical protein